MAGVCIMLLVVVSGDRSVRGGRISEAPAVPQEAEDASLLPPYAAWTGQSNGAAIDRR